MAYRIWITESTSSRNALEERLGQLDDVLAVSADDPASANVAVVNTLTEVR